MVKAWEAAPPPLLPQWGCGHDGPWQVGTARGPFPSHRELDPSLLHCSPPKKLSIFSRGTKSPAHSCAMHIYTEISIYIYLYKEIYIYV